MATAPEETGFAPNMEPIAIIGMSCTLAGGVDRPSKLWQTLIDKKIQLSDRVPASRFNIDAYYQENAFGLPAAIGSKGGFFLETDLHAFDAGFFGYEADEARHMDPQHFRTLESVYECLESAGRTLEDVKGTSTAVYIGNFGLDKVINSARNSYDDRHLHEVIGIDPGLLSSRVSYCYDMKGPVFTTNTGCTSSLFALHTAAMALRGGEANAAIVGGVNLLQGPETYSSYSKFGIMSADSMCHSYDARCNGYCRGEGVGALYVRLLKDAVRDNDPIRGVIRSVAVNTNGYVPGMPMFVPNKVGIENAMRLAYKQANLDPYDTAFVETHGIGMVIGEIAEAHAIGTFMNEPKRRDKPLPIGSLKPNFGHAEAGSGVFVLIKGALMTEAGVIPAHADFESPHPAIDLDALNIKPQTESIAWPQGYPSRRVGISSYGWSGTNVHIIMENVQSLYPNYSVVKTKETKDHDHATKRPLLLKFSAFEQSSLEANIANHQAVAAKYYLADLAYTLNDRRSNFNKRAFVIASDEESGDSLRTATPYYGEVSKGKIDVNIGLPNTGSALKALAAECLGTFPAFIDAIAKLHDLLADSDKKIDLVNFIRTDVPGAEKSLNSVAELAVKMALVDTIKAFGIEPQNIHDETEDNVLTAYVNGLKSAAETVKTVTGEFMNPASDWEHTAEIKSEQHSGYTSAVMPNASGSGAVAAECDEGATDTAKDEPVELVGAAGDHDLPTSNQHDYEETQTEMDTGLTRDAGTAQADAKATEAALPSEEPPSELELSKTTGSACEESSAVDTATGVLGESGETGAKANQHCEPVVDKTSLADRSDSPMDEHHNAMPDTETTRDEVQKVEAASSHVQPPEERVLEQPTLPMKPDVPQVGPTGRIETMEDSVAEQLVSKIADPTEIQPEELAVAVGIDPVHDTVQELQADTKDKGTSLPGQEHGTQVSERQFQLATLGDILRMAGQLYVEGVPIKFAKINEVVDANWAPSFVVDLPPYQWDHSKSFFADSYANMEQRANKHPYHELLGRRIFGLSPETNIWKHKLSYNDLPTSIPWIPNPKPDTLISLPQFLVMAIMAVTQTFEDRPITDFSFESFKVHQGLHYGGDVDEIELQTSLTTLLDAGVEEGPWRLLFESVKDRNWTKHCTGTVKLERTAAAHENDAESAAERSAERSSKIDLDSIIGESGKNKYLIHPGLVECALKAASAALTNQPEDTDKVLSASDVQIHRCKVLTRSVAMSGDWTVCSTLLNGEDLIKRSVQVVLKDSEQHAVLSFVATV